MLLFLYGMSLSHPGLLLWNHPYLWLGLLLGMCAEIVVEAYLILERWG